MGGRYVVPGQYILRGNLEIWDQLFLWNFYSVVGKEHEHARTRPHLILFIVREHVVAPYYA